MTGWKMSKNSIRNTWKYIIHGGFSIVMLVFGGVSFDFLKKSKVFKIKDLDVFTVDVVLGALGKKNSCFSKKSKSGFQNNKHFSKSTNLFKEQEPPKKYNMYNIDLIGEKKQGRPAFCGFSGTLRISLQTFRAATTQDIDVTMPPTYLR